MIAQELMTKTPVCIHPTASLRRAVETMREADIRHLPVVDDDGQLIGMVSDRDVRALSIPYFLGREFLEKVQEALDGSVANVMSGDVLSVSDNAPVSEVADLMVANKIGAVPVTDGDGALVGIISYVDILRSIQFTD